jgi:glycosyltransferase involved in cell wall biosynthesis
MTSRPGVRVPREDTRFPRPIVHIIWHLDIGGGEVFLHGLTGALARRGVPQHVFTVGPPGRLAASVEAAGARVTSFHKTSKIGGLTILRMAARLVRLRPSLVQTHGEGGMYWGLAAARLAGMPAISLLYQNAEETRIKTWAARTALRSPLAVIAGSLDVARFVRGVFRVPPARLQTIPCGIDTLAFAGAMAGSDRDRPGPVIVTVGRLVRRKGHHVLIDALAVVRDRHPHARLLIVGEGPERTALEAQAADRGMANRVTFMGTVYPTASVLAGADLFVFPSIGEPQGLALLEAYAAGVPVVASRTGGIPEMLTDGIEGLLAPPGDAGGLAGAMLHMLADDALRCAVVNRARLRARAFDVASLADRYLALYRTLGAAQLPHAATDAGPAAAGV